MSFNRYGFSGGVWVVTTPEGKDGFHEVSIGDSDEWSDVTFYGVKARENAHLFKASPDMYKEIEDDIKNLKSMLMEVDPSSLESADIEKKISRKEKLLAKARGEL